MELRSLVIRSKKGDDEAFCELISNCRDNLYKIAYAYCKNEDDAVDIVSDTVYKAYMHMEKLNKPEFFNTWITRILINSAKDFYKKHKALTVTDEIEKLSYMNPSHISTNSNCEESIDLYNAIDRLNDNYKSIVILKYFQDLTLSEIADILEFPVGTVKSYLHRALGVLKIELREEV